MYMYLDFASKTYQLFSPSIVSLKGGLFSRMLLQPDFIVLFCCNSEDVTGFGVRFRLYGVERMRRERMIGESIIGFASISLDSPSTHWVILEPRSNLSVGICCLAGYMNIILSYSPVISSSEFYHVTNTADLFVSFNQCFNQAYKSRHTSCFSLQSSTSHPLRLHVPFCRECPAFEREHQLSNICHPRQLDINYAQTWAIF